MSFPTPSFFAGRFAADAWKVNLVPYRNPLVLGLILAC
jgi:hypothetical protein